VDFVNEEHRFRAFLHGVHEPLHAVLKVAAILRAGHEPPHGKRTDDPLLQNIRHFPGNNAACDTFRDRGLADPRLTDQQRIILSAAAEHLDHAGHLFLAPDQRIKLPLFGLLIQIHRKGIKNSGTCGAGFRSLVSGGTRGFGERLLIVVPMKIREVFDKTQLIESLLGEISDSPAVRLIKNRDEHIFPMQILILAAGLLHVHQGPLDHTLEPDRRLRILFQCRELRHLRIDKFLEIPLQLRLGAAKVGKDAADTVIREQFEQQRLDRNQLTADRCRRDECVLKVLFQLSVDHDYSCRSTKHRKGKPLSFARCIALAARLSATSFT